MRCVVVSKVRSAFSASRASTASSSRCRLICSTLDFCACTAARSSLSRRCATCAALSIPCTTPAISSRSLSRSVLSSAEAAWTCG
jgi:hypothetical protein